MSPAQREPAPTRSIAHPPELPRVSLDTRMPAAPAPGGRIIVVGAPDRQPRRSDVALGGLAIGAIAVIALLFRWARSRRPG
jgi:hypothetical protein